MSQPSLESREKYAKSDKRKVTKWKWRGIVFTVEEYNVLFSEQEGRCAICGRHQSTCLKALFVDHNHVTREVRGLLCNKCNFLLGYANDNREILLRAADYLAKHP